ncbi:uncharacterized protein SPPG_02921 [Spizellomyces punctatus DAOM BR117]|uniref:Peptidase S54 rhomboid domain-containing protein n=1 Tax=Spizellomyces punctatus (strain DAOM BR117) TaxID=645134 RepID=A0A0L0HMY1_SPIPD|nr:uncharacterized protein SPPG_02921 [Spizellomyces punctatus DAOM BR117]KND02457.1 hypothetical protein SPPG_02921 [Spizellomyces punctatus DAOM BR117]|eukprot:XP_016610496.1 hypothetical protein SPPG_02921 [Spizellomyces punctatus DAOM BR117]
MPLPGTHLALVGTISLTLPSLISIYHTNLGLSSPLIPFSRIYDTLHFTYQPRPKFKLLSRKESIVGHLFHHVDIAHWFGNTYAILSSGYFLDLGLIKTLVLIIGGGVTGAVTHILEWTIKTGPIPIPLVQSEPEPTSLLSDIVTDAQNLFTSIFTTTAPAPLRTPERLLPPSTYSLCGASAAAYALTGAEIAAILWAVKEAWGRKGRSRIGDRDRVRKLIVVALGRLVAVVAQVVASMEPGRRDGPLIIGHGAHLGGFLFGFIVMGFWQARRWI